MTELLVLLLWAQGPLLPPAEDLIDLTPWLPTLEQAKVFESFGVLFLQDQYSRHTAHIHYLKTLKETQPNHRQVDEWLTDTLNRFQAWDALLDFRRNVNVEYRRNALAVLRFKLGDDAFILGRMPEPFAGDVHYPPFPSSDTPPE